MRHLLIFHLLLKNAQFEFRLQNHEGVNILTVFIGEL